MSSRDYIKHLVGNTSPAVLRVGDEVFDPGSNRLFKTIAVDGTNTSSIEVPVYIPNRPVRFPQSANNYFQFEGSNTGNTVIASTQGIDNNISMSFAPKGTGGFNIQSSGVNLSNTGSVTAVTVMASGVYTSFPTGTISAPTTAGGVQATFSFSTQITNIPTITSGGTGYTVNDVLTFVGGTFTVAGALTVTSVSGGVITGVSVAAYGAYTALPSNPISVTGGTGSGATFTSTWGVRNAFPSPTITNAGSGYVEQPTVTFSGGGGSGAAAYATIGSTSSIKTIASDLSFFTPGGEAFRVRDTGTATVNYISANGDSSTGNTPGLLAGGPSGVLNFRISTKSSGQIIFATNSNSQTQFIVSHTGSAVNYLQATGSTTGNLPGFYAQGSDTNVGMVYSTKGFSASHRFLLGGSEALRLEQFGSTGVVNRFSMFSNTTGAAPLLATRGTDTDVGFDFSTQGLGSYRFYSNTQSNGTGTQLFAIANANTSVNYLQVTGAGTGNTVVMSAQGTDANVAMTFLPKGNGAFNISTANGVNISSGNTSVTNIVRTNSGTGSATIPTITISPPTTAGGVTATAVVLNSIQYGTSPTINSGGTGYSVNDVLTIVGGTPSSLPSTMTVTAVSGGVITAVSYTYYGSYTVLPTNAYTTTGGTGTGAQFSSLWYPNTFTITNIGSGYVEQPTVTVSGGTGFTAYATVGSVPKIQTLASQLDFFTPGGRAFMVEDGGVAQTGYIKATGGTTSPYFTATGSATDVNMGLYTKGAGAFQFRTNFGTLQFNIAHTASAVNYVQVTGATTGSGPKVTAQGSDTNINLDLQTKGTGYVNLVNNRTNFFQFYGGNTGQSPTIYAWGSDTNIDLNVTSKGTGSVVLNTGNGTAFKASDTGSTAVNYLVAVNQSTGNGPRLRSDGTDTNINMVLSSKGTGSILFFTNTEANRQFQIADTPSAVNYVQVTGASTGNDPTISAQGSDANAGLIFLSKGSTGLTFRTRGGGTVRNALVLVDNGASSVNYLQIQSNLTTTAPILSAQGSDTNIDLNLATKGTGGINFQTGATTATQLRVADTAGAVNYLQIGGGVSNDDPYISQVGSQSRNIRYRTGSGATHIFETGSYGNIQTSVTHTASAVNYVQLTGAVTTASPTISAQGSDTNISLNLNAKGSGGVNTQFYHTVGSGYANKVQITGTSTTLVPIVSAQGTDTNVSLAFQTKGTGAIDLAAGGSGVNISNGGTVTAITRTGVGSGYTTSPTVVISAPTTAGGVQANVTTAIVGYSPTIGSGGTGYTVNDVLTISGGTFTGLAMQVTVTSVSGGVITGVSLSRQTDYTAAPTNPASVTGGTGSGATVNITWGVSSSFTINTAGSGYVEQPTVSFSGGGGSGAAAFATIGTTTVVRSIGGELQFHTPGSIGGGQPGFSVRNNAGQNANYLATLPSSSGGSVYTGIIGSDTNVGSVWFTRGTGPHYFNTAGGSSTQFLVNHTASAVNYVQVAGSATLSGAPTISSQGSDSNIPLRLMYKGNGGGSGQGIQLVNPAGWAGLAVQAVNNPNYFNISGNASGSAPVLSVLGPDTDIDLSLTTKGAGRVTTSAPLVAGLISGGTF